MTRSKPPFIREFKKLAVIGGLTVVNGGRAIDKVSDDAEIEGFSRLTRSLQGVIGVPMDPVPPITALEC